MKKCEVLGCKGYYQPVIECYVNLSKVHTDKYKISIEEYNALENKKGYNRVVSEYCDICNDSLEKRLLSFNHNNFNPCDTTDKKQYVVKYFEQHLETKVLFFKCLAENSKDALELFLEYSKNKNNITILGIHYGDTICE